MRATNIYVATIIRTREFALCKNALASNFSHVFSLPCLNIQDYYSTRAMENS